MRRKKDIRFSTLASVTDEKEQKNGGDSRGREKKIHTVDLDESIQD